MRTHSANTWIKYLNTCTWYSLKICFLRFQFQLRTGCTLNYLISVHWELKKPYVLVSLSCRKAIYDTTILVSLALEFCMFVAIQNSLNLLTSCYDIIQFTWLNIYRNFTPWQKKNPMCLYVYRKVCKNKMTPKSFNCRNYKTNRKNIHISEGNFLKLLKSFKVWVKWWK